MNYNLLDESARVRVWLSGSDAHSQVLDPEANIQVLAIAQGFYWTTTTPKRKKCPPPSNHPPKNNNLQQIGTVQKEPEAVGGKKYLTEWRGE